MGKPTTAPDRQWTIIVVCDSVSNNQTKVEVTYSSIRFNEEGNMNSQNYLDRMFEHDLIDGGMQLIFT